MKDFIAVAFALTVASTSGVSRSDVMSAMKTANNDPEALATNLLQYGEANTDRDINDCTDMTGYEHCTKCAMPSIQKLVTALVAVKNEAWTDQKTITDQAANVCNSANPSDRYGGNAKCCSASVTASLYAPSGFAGCTAATFSPESAEPTAQSMGTMGGAHADSNVKYNRDHGFYFEASGSVTPSSMVQDCCTSTSTCRANEGTLSTTVATAIAELNTAKEGIEGAVASKKATTMEIALEHAKLVRTNAGIKKICQAADHADADFDEGTPSAMPVANDDTATITSKCPGDCQIKTIVERQAARKVKIAAHTASVVRTKAIITKVIEWLDADTNGDGSAHIFDSHSNTRDGGSLLKNGISNADGFDSSLALLESATKQTTNAASLASLQKATSLLQGAGRDGGTGTQGMSRVLQLLRQIELDFTKQITQLGVYSQQMDTEEDTDLDNMRDQIVDLEAERTAAIAQEVALQDKLSTFDNDIQTKHTEVGTKMSEWKSAYEARETNAKKCSIFMTFFDSETVVNTEELLVLKKAIDIIKHITCGTSQAPTAAPTAFPTAAPNADPTAFPTRSPTSAPTSPPSADADAVVAEACVATHTYRFMQDVYTNPDKYAVPSYTDGIRYSIPQTADGACQTIETSHTNVEGAVQTIEHEYKCCDGSYYGAISYDDAANSLCGLAAADHCGLFGANMYYGDKDPSAPCPSACDIGSCDDWADVDGTCHTEAELATYGDTAGSHADCTGCATTKAHQAKLSGIGITLAPTKAPTAYPTRTPTTSPTAAANVTVVHRTDAPTAAPTAFPTAVHHEGRDVELLTDGTDQGNMSKHDAGKYNITMQSLDETAAPTGFPTAYPTASPTEAPTAYPTAAPTPAPTEYPTAAPTAAPTAPTEYPTAAPTKAPTKAPTAAPTVFCPAGPVVWRAFSNTGVLSSSAGTMRRNSGAAWDAGAISQQTIQHSSAQQGVQFRMATTGNSMIGLANGNTDGHFYDIDFAIYGAQGAVHIYENTNNRAIAGRRYLAGDLFEVRVVGTVVTYLQNGVVFYTSSKTPTFPLVVDTSLLQAGAAVLDVAITC